MRAVSWVLERSLCVSLDCPLCVTFLRGDGFFFLGEGALLTSPSGDPSKVILSSASSCIPLSQLTFPKSKGHPCSLNPSSIARRRYLPSAEFGLR